ERHRHEEVAPKGAKFFDRLRRVHVLDQQERHAKPVSPLRKLWIAGVEARDDESDVVAVDPDQRVERAGGPDSAAEVADPEPAHSGSSSSYERVAVVPRWSQ